MLGCVSETVVSKGHHDQLKRFIRKGIRRDRGPIGYYLVMKYLEGEALDAYVSRKDPNHEGLPLNQVLAILSRVGVALDYAHSEGGDPS